MKWPKEDIGLRVHPRGEMSVVINECETFRPLFYKLDLAHAMSKYFKELKRFECQRLAHTYFQE